MNARQLKYSLISGREVHHHFLRCAVFLVAVLLGAVDAVAQTFAEKTLFFPQIADGVGSGGAWQTTFTIAYRANAVGVTATVNFYDDNGSPMNLSVNGQQVSQVTVAVAPFGLAQFKTDGTGVLQTGWATVQSDSNESLSGLALYTFSNTSGAFVDEVGSPATVASSSMSVFTQLAATISTGVALANPNTTPADIALVLRDKNSNEIGRTTIQIPAMGHLARYVPELFPNLGSATLDGKMDIVASQPIAVLTLRQRQTVFTSFPEIDGGIDATLLALDWESIPGSSRRFRTFGAYGVNPSGDIAFGAGVSEGSGNDSGLFEISNAKLTSLVLPDQPVPGRPGMVFRQTGGPAGINSAVDVAFIGNFASPGATIYEGGVFVASGGAIQKIADGQTLLPGSTNQYLCCYSSPHVNDRGDVSFEAKILYNNASVSSGIFLMSQNVLSSVALSSGTLMLGSMNNNGDIVYNGNGSLFLYSNGSIKTIATVGQAIPNTTLTVNAYTSSIDDLQEVVFTNVNYYFCNFCSQIVGYAIARWTAGTLAKVVAVGDPIPGISGATLASFDIFSQPRINPTGVLVPGGMAFAGSSFDVGFLAEVQNGSWTMLERSDQQPSGEIVPGVGTPACCGSPNFDQQNRFLTGTGGSNPFFIGALLLRQLPTPSYSLSFPQIADGTGAGGGWQTTFYLANRSNSQTTATVTFYDDTGTPMSVSIGGQQTTQITISLPPLATTELKTDGTGVLKTGWATLQADQSIAGLALFTFLDDSGGFVDEVGSPATIALRSTSAFAQTSPGISTGVAIANPNSSPADVTLIATDLNLQEMASTTITLPAMGHIARYITELFPQAALRTFDGKIEVISAWPLATLALRQRESVFTTYPVIP
jgi:hypothetical protein